MLARLFRRNAYERAAYELYGIAVAAARNPWFYEALDVPDTLDGRFDLIGLHAFLIIRRLQSAPDPGKTLAQAVFDAMFHDMDLNLREMGVGDLGVSKRIRIMWEAFHGRAAAYQPMIDAGDRGGLAAALARNVWRGDGVTAGLPERLAEYVFDAAASLAATSDAALRGGKFAFPAVPAAVPAEVPVEVTS